MSTLPRASWLARLAVVGVSLLLFVVACATPTVYFENDVHEPWPGLMTLILGLFALLEGYVGWLANPIGAIALVLVLVRQWVAASAVAAVAFLIALTSFVVLGDTVPLDEGGVNKAVATSLGLGFYLWLASILTPAVGALTLRFSERTSA